MKRRIVNVFATGSFLMFLFVVSRFTYIYYQLKEHGVSTQGTITSIHRDWRGHDEFSFVFTVNDREFEGTASYAKEHLIPKIGQRIAVKYSSENPNINRVVME